MRQPEREVVGVDLLDQDARRRQVLGRATQVVGVDLLDDARRCQVLEHASQHVGGELPRRGQRVEPEGAAGQRDEVADAAGSRIQPVQPLERASAPGRREESAIGC